MLTAVATVQYTRTLSPNFGTKDNPGTDGKKCSWNSKETSSGSGQIDPEANVCSKFDWCDTNPDQDACIAMAGCAWHSDGERCEFDPAATDELYGATHSLIDSPVDATDCDQLESEECNGRDFEDPVYWAWTNLTRCMWKGSLNTYCVGYDERTDVEIPAGSNGLQDAKARERAIFCSHQSNETVCEAAVLDVRDTSVPRTCRWKVATQGYCSRWQGCQGRQDTLTKAGCEARELCVWRTDFASCTDVHLMTTSSTSRTTVSTTTHEPCPASRFSCGSGQCIPVGWACDGQKDCGKQGEPFYGADESPEAGCAVATSTTATTTTNTTTTTTTTVVTTKRLPSTAETTSVPTVGAIRTTQQVTSTYTATTKTTTTTWDTCVLNGICASAERFKDALNTRDPLFSTSADCRACALNITVQTACKQHWTRGCSDASNSKKEANGASLLDPDSRPSTPMARTSTVAADSLLKVPSTAHAVVDVNAATAVTVTTPTPTEQSSTNATKNKAGKAAAFAVVLLLVVASLVAVVVKTRMQRRSIAIATPAALKVLNPAYTTSPGGPAKATERPDLPDDGGGARGQEPPGGMGPGAAAVGIAASAPLAGAYKPGGGGGRHFGVAATFTLQPIDETAAAVHSDPGPSAGGLAPVLTLGSGLDATLEC